MTSRRTLDARFETIDALLVTIASCEETMDRLLGHPDRLSIYPSVAISAAVRAAPLSGPGERLLTTMAGTADEEALARSLAARIREARRAKGWRQQDLAEATGIARPNIARIESGRRMPKIGTLHRIGQALSLSMETVPSNDEG